MQIKNTESSRANPLATMILGLGTAVALTLATPALAATKGAGVLMSTGALKDRAQTAIPANPVSTEAGRPTSPTTPFPTTSALLPPDPCSTGLDEVDCNGNGVNDRCDIVAGMADDNQNGYPDSCEFGWGDLDLDGVVGARDLVLVLNDWGAEGHDTNSDGIVDGRDLAVILANWSSAG